jgi:hypothetical protein
MECRFKERDLTLIKDASTQGHAVPWSAILSLVSELANTGTGAIGDPGC